MPDMDTLTGAIIGFPVAVLLFAVVARVILTARDFKH